MKEPVIAGSALNLGPTNTEVSVNQLKHLLVFLLLLVLSSFLNHNSLFNSQ